MAEIIDCRKCTHKYLHVTVLPVFAVRRILTTWSAAWVTLARGQKKQHIPEGVFERDIGEISQQSILCRSLACMGLSMCEREYVKCKVQ